MTVSKARRVRAEEWERVRALRLLAVADPAAPIAFLTTTEEEAARDDEFWRVRAADGAGSDAAAQFVLEEDDEWAGTLTVLRARPGSQDHLGRLIREGRADVVGVFLREESRGRGGLEKLMDEAGAWARSQGEHALTLQVHFDNLRAQSAYRRLGFHRSGAVSGPNGPELEMTLAL